MTPSSSVTYPSNGSFAKAVVTITGSATDSYTGINTVKVSIGRLSDTTFWTGSDWQTTENWLDATGAPVWNPLFLQERFGLERKIPAIEQQTPNIGEDDITPLVRS